MTIALLGDDRLGPTRVPRLLIHATIAYSVIAATLHLTWIATGLGGWIVLFRLVTAAFLVSVAAFGAAQTLTARAFFQRGDRLRPVWTLLFAAAVCRWTGHAVTNLAPLAANEPLASIAAVPWLAVLFTENTAKLGRVVAGPVSMGLMAVALGGVAVVYRRLGLLVRPTRTDLALVAGAALFAALFVRDLIAWREQVAASATLIDAVSWASDPLLALLLLQAIVIRRAAVHMGAGYISRCWSALAAGILLMSIGDAGLWAATREYVAWPWSSLFWYVWPPAEVAFALAPAWQVIASEEAQAFAERPLTAPATAGPGAIARAAGASPSTPSSVPDKPA